MTSSIRPTAIVADDEEHLRAHLVGKLARLWPELSIVAEAANGPDAVAAIRRHGPDLAFLDIRMPGFSGLEVAREIGDGTTRFVFVTAYDQYALDAFEREAVDYLVKPVGDDRLARTIERLRRTVSDARAAAAAPLDAPGSPDGPAPFDGPMPVDAPTAVDARTSVDTPTSGDTRTSGDTPSTRVAPPTLEALLARLDQATRALEIGAPSLRPAGAAPLPPNVGTGTDTGTDTSASTGTGTGTDAGLPPRADAGTTPNHAPPVAPLRWIRASLGDTTRHIPVEDIRFFRSDDKYTVVHAVDGEHLIRMPLGELVAQLDPEWFWQIHRSTVVNMRHVTASRRDDSGRVHVQLRPDGTELPVSRAYAQRFRQM